LEEIEINTTLALHQKLTFSRFPKEEELETNLGHHYPIYRGLAGMINPQITVP